MFYGCVFYCEGVREGGRGSTLSFARRRGGGRSPGPLCRRFRRFRRHHRHPLRPAFPPFFRRISLLCFIYKKCVEPLFVENTPMQRILEMQSPAPMPQLRKQQSCNVRAPLYTSSTCIRSTMKTMNRLTLMTPVPRALNASYPPFPFVDAYPQPPLLRGNSPPVALTYFEQ